MAKRKAKSNARRKAPARVKTSKNSGGFLSSLAKNQLVMVGLLGVIAIAALVLMLLQIM